MPTTNSMTGIVGTEGGRTTLILTAAPARVTMAVNDTTSGGGQTFLSINGEALATGNSSAIWSNGYPYEIQNKVGIGTITLLAKADHAGQVYTVADTLRMAGT